MQASWLWIPFAVLALLVVLLLLLATRRRGARARVAASVRYTNHARQRMLERGVAEDQIESVLARPARVDRDVEENSVRLEGDFDGRVLKVWVAEPWPGHDEIVVKSTAWTYVIRFAIPARAVGRVKGRDGKTIQAICRETGAQISLDRSGLVRIRSGDRASAESARRKVLTTARR